MGDVADIPVVAPRGNLDLVSSRSLAQQLGELAGSPSSAVLDLSGVRFMDSMGLGVVVKGVSRFRRQEKCLVLVVEPGSAVARLLDFAGMHGRLPLAATLDEARAIAAAER